MAEVLRATPSVDTSRITFTHTYVTYTHLQERIRVCIRDKESLLSGTHTYV